VNWSITDILHKHDEMVNKHELLSTNQREHPKQEKQSKSKKKNKNSSWILTSNQINKIAADFLFC
jgi:hypothetical protein